jgi:DNA-binding response OmpR family regulator
LNSIVGRQPIYLIPMAASTLLCIHRDPDQLSLLREHGYELATATTGSGGLQLFMSRPVDAVVIEHCLGLMEGAAIANEIKQVRPEVPIIMLADDLELPASTLESVDALVVKSDGPHFLLATVHFILNGKLSKHQNSRSRSEMPAHLRRPGRSREAAGGGQAETSQSATEGNDEPFSQEVWRKIRDGTLTF